MSLEIRVLGSNSAIPTLQRHPSAQVVWAEQTPYLIDCGEGTQLQMRRYGVKFQKIRQIFISHLHGDHYFGLLGLLTSMSLLGREKELTVFGPKGILDIVQTNFKYSKTKLNYPCDFVELGEGQMGLIYEDERLSVTCFPLSHRIPTVGFVFREKKKLPHFLKEKGMEYQIPVEKIHHIKKGADFITKDGTCIPNSELVGTAPEAESFAYCSDTKFFPEIVPHIKEVNLLYHEATFTEDMKKRAKETFHSTAKQAAEIASLADVGKLLIGHFSTRYDDLEPLLKDAQEVFQTTELATEGELFSTKR